MTIPTKKAPPPRVDPCQPQKMIMNSKSSVINTELDENAIREKRNDGHVDETEASETGKSIHQTNESVMPYPSLLLLSDVIRLLVFSMVALDRSTVLMALLILMIYRTPNTNVGFNCVNL
ncbi:hypothetical protein ALC62_05425 [Cyphomyrmex costatus]|uniref:Uncharacterized protein n=1 Tax=Cyphomyrmex costatus TaxID=456900 RepID=A0A195CUB2_9HYME|nr:hypothetical protein ALC62_05425 [Cyphomyrmex costatus]